jgi:hypothetical protein
MVTKLVTSLAVITRATWTSHGHGRLVEAHEPGLEDAQVVVDVLEGHAKARVVDADTLEHLGADVLKGSGHRAHRLHMSLGKIRRRTSKAVLEHVRHLREVQAGMLDQPVRVEQERADEPGPLASRGGRLPAPGKPPGRAHDDVGVHQDRLAALGPGALQADVHRSREALVLGFADQLEVIALVPVLEDVDQVLVGREVVDDEDVHRVRDRLADRLDALPQNLHVALLRHVVGDDHQRLRHVLTRPVARR